MPCLDFLSLRSSINSASLARTRPNVSGRISHALIIRTAIYRPVPLIVHVLLVLLGRDPLSAVVGASVS